jgi:glycosyltransferase involved in cell wall biosynthesis
MTNARPLVTVAIPTYSRHLYLKEAIEAALNQSYGNIEILVSDDGSEPGVALVAKAFANTDPRVRYWRNETNLGLAANWNKCVDEARGEYIVILGDDDRLLPDGLQCLIQEGCQDVVFGTHFLIDESGNRLEEASRVYNDSYGRSVLKSEVLTEPELVVWRNSVPMCGALVRTILARQFHFKEDTNTPELILFAELASAGASFRYVDTFVSEYRIHRHSATSSGLWNERLAAYLVALQVSPEAEEVKTRLVQPLLINAVNRCLTVGNVRQAREFVNSLYYPSLFSQPKAALQRILLKLPNRVALPIFHVAANVMKRRARGAKSNVEVGSGSARTLISLDNRVRSK